MDGCYYDDRKTLHLNGTQATNVSDTSAKINVFRSTRKTDTLRPLEGRLASSAF